MSTAAAPRAGRMPAIQRLSALAPLEAADLTLLREALAKAHVLPPRRELMNEGKPIAEAFLIVSGWAARVRILMDGRRQFLSFLLPGDLIGSCQHREPLAVSTVIALTNLTVCHAPDNTPGLHEAYSVSHALEEAYLLAHITRLGRFNAEERIGDLLLEFYERLSLAGLASAKGFDIPLTQEMLADAVGLTPVHVNRTLQQLRRERHLVWKGSRVILPDLAQFAQAMGRLPTRVSAAIG